MSYLPRKARTYEPQRRKVGSFASDHAKRKSGLNRLAITRREALALTAFGVAASPGLVEGFEDQLDTKCEDPPGALRDERLEGPSPSPLRLEACPQ